MDMKSLLFQDIAHADADHREAGTDDSRISAQDLLQPLPEPHFHDPGTTLF